MQCIKDSLVVSPSDLVGYAACGHLITLEVDAAHGRRQKPDQEDPALDVLFKRGLEHEERYLAQLQADGLKVVEIPEPSTGSDGLDAIRERAQETIEAMQEGADVIYQATFLDEREDVLWRGHADFLRKVHYQSDLGDFAYEPVDTKLARAVKPSAVLQLCQYAEQVERIQSEPPKNVHVVLGGSDEISVPHQLVAAYYRVVRDRFLQFLEERPTTYPLPVPHCDICQWREVCQAKWEQDDHLCRVAGIRRDQFQKLEDMGIGTLQELGESTEGLSVHGIGEATFEKLRKQAKLQLRRREDEPPPYELVDPPPEGRGLSLLPEPNRGDLFYDIEGDPHVGDEGLEYLHGLGWYDEHEEFRFEAFWAHSSAEERRAFEQVIDFIVERRRQYPDMHVYHYAPYETTALGRLMGRYGTREEELDDLLRQHVFVDLYRVVRQGLIVGAPSYSIKELEPLYRGGRVGAIADAAASIVEYERWLKTGKQAILEDIQSYNRDDVESTAQLRDWLEGRRDEAIADGLEIPRSALPPERDEDREPRVEIPEVQETLDLYDQLLEGRMEPPSEDADPETRARWLMAHLLFWHRREDKPEWWRYFDRILRADEAELWEDTEAIAGLEQLGDPEPIKKSYVWTYRFDPDQEFKLGEGNRPADPEVAREKYLTGEGPQQPGEIVELDHERGLVYLKRGANSTAPHPRCLIPSGPINTQRQRASLRRVARSLLEQGAEGDQASVGPGGSDGHAVARRLLGNLPPRISGVTPGEPLRGAGEDVVEATIRLAQGLDRSTLPIQGPPGSGKTYTAARVIAALVKDGRRVGIAANSHAVITEVLERTLEAAEETSLELRAIQKAGKTDQHADPERYAHVTVTKNNADVEAAVTERAVDVVAGTAWLFSRDELAASLDTLVIDEAGQLSLANVIAVSPAARNLILVGDPQQLAQPSKGTHPAGAGISALEHVLQGRATIPDDRGLFIDRTRRMHPEICEFVSEQVYDGRLEALEGLERQRVDDGPPTGGAGLRWLPVEHKNNRTSSPEEVDAVAHVFNALLGRAWTNTEGEREELSYADILVVAPYNAQVNRLRDALPDGAQVGTADKFQGQEAPVVLVSLTASSAEDVPRGMEFLYSRNRLNVAVSRGKALSILVGSPALLSVQCKSVEQMKLANVLCRLVEMAQQIGSRP